ncbi:YafY family transcriptional regulator [Actinoallomurus sp. NBC_01490]|uniref:helix-turn-helix transcriptional regulator n=1 Tax=Actinoallomurus sp. NBC_01490 TaxID=2903557 RepID=UPI002E32AD23|nr:YafY family protein [Actinoallomurus sp. NBC_01490]
MSRPTARVLALLEILQAGGVHPLASLAERLGVDARTVRRYIDHLVDLDVPVESVRGRYGGYRLAPGYRMPPLMLTDDEALAALLGLMTVRRTGLGATSAAAADTATAKIRRVLPRPLGRRLTALLATARFTAPADDAVTGPGGRVLLSLAEAAWDRRPVEMRYHARDERRSRRVVHPYGLVAHSGRWYVAGADSISGQVRTFRVDRIEHVEVLSGSFDQPEDFDAAAHVLTGLARTPWAHEVAFRAQATVDRIRSQFPEGVAIVDEVPSPPRSKDEAVRSEGWCRVRLRAERLEWIPPRLAALDRPFVIEQPGELRGLVDDLARRLTRYADTGPS